MLLDKRPFILASLSALLLSLTACATNSNNQALERSFAPDPNLKNNPIPFGKSSQTTPQSQTIVKLPEDFPSEIPLYPQAQLQEVETPTTADAQGNSTHWTTTDPSNLVQSFYQKEFQANGWQISSQPDSNTNSTLVARRNDLEVTLSIQSVSDTASPTPSPSENQAGVTEFVIQYSRNTDKAAVPQPGEPDFIGPVLPSDIAAQPTTTPAASGSNQTPGSVVFNDLNKAPAELRPYIKDLAALGVVTPSSTGAKSNSAASASFEPSKIISRRQYVRWLVTANNRMYADSPSKQIRLASTSIQPAFQDVPRTDPDFPVIQGLADAGLIPSPLSGDATAVLFRPGIPLTRENLILWKVPLDTRQALPSASIDAVKQTWGFQDVARIDPKALRAVLADFQNGEQANIRRVFAYTALFQPKKSVTRAEAAAALWYFGSQGEGITAKEVLQLKNQQSQPSATSEPTPSSSPN